MSLSITPTQLLNISRGGDYGAMNIRKQITKTKQNKKFGFNKLIIFKFKKQYFKLVLKVMFFTLTKKQNLPGATSGLFYGAES